LSYAKKYEEAELWEGAINMYNEALRRQGGKKLKEDIKTRIEQLNQRL